MHRIKIELRQYTPLIHFQPDQHGATLRATEVKPKLDRYLLSKVGEAMLGGFVKKSENGAKALDYRLKIIPGNVQFYNIEAGDQKFPLFFGNLGNEKKEGEESKQFSFDKGLIQLEILTVHESLKQAIEQYIADFFLVHNFGTRQSKGFGSFGVEKIDGKAFSITNPKLKEVFRYYFWVDAKQDNKNGPHLLDTEFKTLFETIELVYRSLRGGINICWGNSRYYFKSLMFCYANEELKVQWEKKTIKQHFFTSHLTSQQEKHGKTGKAPDILGIDQKPFALVKDLMGLASEEAWKAEYDSGIKKTHAPKKKEDMIERFPSPIMFKPIWQQGSFIVGIKIDQELVREILGQTFTMEDNNGSAPFQLNVPKTFDFDAFLKFAFQRDLDKHVHKKYHDHQDHKKLKIIYTYLKRQA